MNELIERLWREAAAWEDWNEDHPDDAAVTTLSLLREAATALKAAREDSERLDWMDIHRGDDVRQDPHSGDPVLVAHYWAIAGQCTDIRTAIDQAREKEGENGT